MERRWVNTVRGKKDIRDGQSEKKKRTGCLMANESCVRKVS